MLNGAAAISGISELAPSGDAGGADTTELLLRVAHGAMVDAGLEPRDVDGIITDGTAGMGGALTLADHLGLQPTYVGTCDTMGASSAGMVWRAAAAIATGQATAVVCTTASAHGARRRPSSSSPPRPPRPALDPKARQRQMSMFGPAEFELPYGVAAVNYGYALIAQRHAYEFGTTDRQRAKIAVDQRTNAGMNPMARYRDPMTVDDVLESRLVFDPLHLLEIVRPSAGGAAYVVAAPAPALAGGHPPVWLRGAAEKVEQGVVARAASLTTSPVAHTAPRAFEMAGVTPADIDLVSAYDCYTIMVLMTLEDAGFCPKGKGGPFVEEHDLTYRGDLPVNTHGGQLSFGQAGVAGGASHVTEAVRQLRGEAGDRQIADCELAFVNGNGGIMSEECSLVLGR